VSTAFVVPAYQAEASVGAVVSDLRRAARGLGSSETPIIVVDDGSTDQTRALAEQASAIVLVHPANRGKGAALMTGLRKAYELGARTAVSVDADGQHPANEAVALARHAAPEGALLLGVRDLLGAGAPRANRFSNAFSNQWMSWFSARALRDTQCGLRRYPLPETLELGLVSTGYEFEAEVILKAVRSGLPVLETNVRVIYPPAGERVTHFRNVRDPARIVFRILHTALTTRFRRLERS
jgi:glycosyltransferase involved in cell wall biosynthesis